MSRTLDIINNTSAEDLEQYLLLGEALQARGIAPAHFPQIPRHTAALKKMIAPSKPMFRIQEALDTAEDPPAEERILVEDLDFSIRLYATLKREGINYIDQLARLTRKQLASIRNMGERNIDEVIERLESVGFTLKQ